MVSTYRVHDCEILNTLRVHVCLEPRVLDKIFQCKTRVFDKENSKILGVNVWFQHRVLDEEISKTLKVHVWFQPRLLMRIFLTVAERTHDFY